MNLNHRLDPGRHRRDRAPANLAAGHCARPPPPAPGPPATLRPPPRMPDIAVPARNCLRLPTGSSPVGVADSVKVVAARNRLPLPTGVRIYLLPAIAPT